jgi:hypothetical protein
MLHLWLCLASDDGAAGIKYWKKNKIGPFYWTLVLGGWPVKTIRVYSYCSENRTSDQRSNDEQLIKAKRDPVWPDSGPWAPTVWTRALQWKAVKSKRVFHSVSLSISEFNAFSHVCNIITRAARSANLSSTLSATIVLSLVFFNPPSQSDTIPHTLSFCANCSRFRFPLFLKIFFSFFFHKDTFHFQWNVSAGW